MLSKIVSYCYATGRTHYLLLSIRFAHNQEFCCHSLFIFDHFHHLLCHIAGVHVKRLIKFLVSPHFLCTVQYWEMKERTYIADEHYIILSHGKGVDITWGARES